MNSFYLAPEHLDAMVAQARSEASQEICGLIVGAGNQAVQVIPISNRSQSPQTCYEADAVELYRALREIEASNLELLGMYHSHPSSPAMLSTEDIRQARLNYPGKVQVILSLGSTSAKLRAWRVHHDWIDTLAIVTNPKDILEERGLNRRQQVGLTISTAFFVLAFLWVAFTLLPPAPKIP